MAERQADPRKLLKNAVPALGLFIVLACATPVIASQNAPSDCAELEDAGLQVPIMKIAAASVTEHQATDPDPAALGTRPIKTASATPLLKAPAESMSEQVLYGHRTPLAKTLPGDDTESPITQKHESTDKLPDIQTRIPGVSSVELKRFKRQMYRRDI